MTRTAAREIAIQICYASLLSGTPVNEVTDALFAPEYFSTLSEENEIFRTKPNEKQLSYIRTLTSETASHTFGGCLGRSIVKLPKNPPFRADFCTCKLGSFDVY